MIANLFFPRMGTSRDDDFEIVLYPERPDDVKTLIRFLQKAGVEKSQEKDIKCHKISLIGCLGNKAELVILGVLNHEEIKYPDPLQEPY